jgi:hypothetical protein
LLRLYAVYPVSSTGKATFVAIFSFPVAITTTRIVLVCTATALYAKTVTNVTDPTLAASSNISLVHMPLLKVEGACALVEHMYVINQLMYGMRLTMTRVRTQLHLYAVFAQALRGVCFLFQVWSRLRWL